MEAYSSTNKVYVDTKFKIIIIGTMMVCVVGMAMLFRNMDIPIVYGALIGGGVHFITLMYSDKISNFFLR